MVWRACSLSLLGRRCSLRCSTATNTVSFIATSSWTTSSMSMRHAAANPRSPAPPAIAMHAGSHIGACSRRLWATRAGGRTHVVQEARREEDSHGGCPQIAHTGCPQIVHLGCAEIAHAGCPQIVHSDCAHIAASRYGRVVGEGRKRRGDESGSRHGTCGKGDRWRRASTLRVECACLPIRCGESDPCHTPPGTAHKGSRLSTPDVSSSPIAPWTHLRRPRPPVSIRSQGEDSELKLIDFGFAHECVNGVGEGMWEQARLPHQRSRARCRTARGHAPTRPHPLRPRWPQPAAHPCARSNQSDPLHLLPSLPLPDRHALVHGAGAVGRAREGVRLVRRHVGHRRGDLHAALGEAAISPPRSRAQGNDDQARRAFLPLAGGPGSQPPYPQTGSGRRHATNPLSPPASQETV